MGRSLDLVRRQMLVDRGIDDGSDRPWVARWFGRLLRFGWRVRFFLRRVGIGLLAFLVRLPVHRLLLDRFLVAGVGLLLLGRWRFADLDLRRHVRAALLQP